MIKNNQTPTAPVVTSLPLPNSDNAMVIDLPDGQKLVIGKIASGSVIEVATWRGTGRPDSRTTRLMLGMSTLNSSSSESIATPNPQITKKKNDYSISKRVIAKILRLIIVTIVVVAIPIALFFAGIRVAHPQAGLSNALGPAKSAIVIFKETTDVNIGDTVIASSQQTSTSPVLGNVSAKTANYYTIKNGRFLEPIPTSHMRGKLLVIVPFLGYALGAIGL